MNRAGDTTTQFWMRHDAFGIENAVIVLRRRSRQARRARDLTCRMADGLFGAETCIERDDAGERVCAGHVSESHDRLALRARRPHERHGQGLRRRHARRQLRARRWQDAVDVSASHRPERAIGRRRAPSSMAPSTMFACSPVRYPATDADGDRSRVENCGASLAFDGVRTATCPYCASPNFVERPPAHGSARSAVRRHVRRRCARSRAARSIAGSAAARCSPTPRSSARRSRTSSGIYVPSYLYSAVAHTDYTAQIGENYTETETYTETDSRGQHRDRDAHGDAHRVSAARRAITSATSPTSSSARRPGLSNAELERVEPFDLKQMRRFDRPRSCRGWIAEEFARTADRVREVEPRRGGRSDRRQAAHASCRATATAISRGGRASLGVDGSDPRAGLGVRGALSRGQGAAARRDQRPDRQDQRQGSAVGVEDHRRRSSFVLAAIAAIIFIARAR